jgi:hypothetical protein
MSARTNRLQRSLLLAQACLADSVLLSANNGDPLGLNLPPLFEPGSGALPDVAALRLLAALYLHAELEQTGLVPLAEALSVERGGLLLQSTTAAAKLERFAQQQRDWYDRAQRLQLFARLFGLGGAGGSPVRQDANDAFQQQFAHLCYTINQVAEDYRWGQNPGPIREAALRLAARTLLMNLGSRQYGNTLLAGRKIQAQVQAAIDIVSDPDIGGLVQGRGLWDTLRKFYGSQTPDLGRLLNRGQSGQRLMTWLALVLPELQREPPGQPLLPAGSPVFIWAATWLEATGIPKPSGG